MIKNKSFSLILELISQNYSENTKEISKLSHVILTLNIIRPKNKTKLLIPFTTEKKCFFFLEKN